VWHAGGGHGRRRLNVRDLPVADRPVVLVWAKRLSRCPDLDCAVGTRSEEVDDIASRAALTDRHGVSIHRGSRCFAGDDEPADRRLARLFEFAVVTGACDRHPVPSVRRSSGLRERSAAACSGVSRRDGPAVVAAWCGSSRRLPDALEPHDVAEFVSALGSHRDRPIVLLMLLGGLRAGEVRSLRLADVDAGTRRVRVIGKGGRDRVVPVDRVFFVALAYLRGERSTDAVADECFVVPRGPIRGQAMTEAGMRRLFRTHRAGRGAIRVRPHRLRHAYGTELAARGDRLLVLRALMGHGSPETTAGYVHLSPAGQSQPNTREGQATMTLAYATEAVGSTDLAAACRTHVKGLPYAQRCKRLRILGLERFLARFGDAPTWITRPTSARLDDIRRTDA
jgi:integrase